MAINYPEDELLALSGIQHFSFCERQWALIHVENQWAENLRTVEGKHLHERVDDPYFTEIRKDVKVIRAVPLVSWKLGLYGVADAIEYQYLPNQSSLPVIRIIEYKRGKPKPDERDEVQLCAQAMCLEEMQCIELDYGFMFYGETRHRHKVEFSEKLRERVNLLAGKMHDFLAKGITPMPTKNKKCKNCSLVDLCVPSLGKKKGKAAVYLKSLVEEMEKGL
jgi:CRISPR-associated exonuclease Cas4